MNLATRFALQFPSVYALWPLAHDRECIKKLFSAAPQKLKVKKSPVLVSAPEGGEPINVYNPSSWLKFGLSRRYQGSPHFPPIEEVIERPRRTGEIMCELAATRMEDEIADVTYIAGDTGDSTPEMISFSSDGQRYKVIRGEGDGRVPLYSAEARETMRQGDLNRKYQKGVMGDHMLILGSPAVDNTIRVWLEDFPKDYYQDIERDFYDTNPRRATKRTDAYRMQKSVQRSQGTGSTAGPGSCEGVYPIPSDPAEWSNSRVLKVIALNRALLSQSRTGTEDLVSQARKLVGSYQAVICLNVAASLLPDGLRRLQVLVESARRAQDVQEYRSAKSLVDYTVKAIEETPEWARSDLNEIRRVATLSFSNEK